MSSINVGSAKKMKLPKIVEKELDATKLPYSVVQGTAHKKIWVAGYFIGILPTGRCKDAHGERGNKNLCAQIRRVSRIVQERVAQP
jgi:hypothetical protein